MNFLKLLKLDLDLFDGGEGASSGVATGSSGNMGETMASPVDTQQDNSGEEGTQDAVSTTKDSSDAENNKATLEERKKAFRELINGEYKDLYTEETQKMMNRRFKEVKELENTVQKNKAVIDQMMERYKISDGDVDKLSEALENDSAYWEEEADKAGMDVDMYKHMKKLERDSKELERIKADSARKRAEEEKFRRWYEESLEVQKAYPDFNLQSEIKNQEFYSMLRSGVPMQHAYEVMHLGDIKTNLSQNVAKQTEKQVVDNVRSKGARPSENGTSSQSGFTTKNDVSKMSKQEINDIIKRVERGEIIKL